MAVTDTTHHYIAPSNILSRAILKLTSAIGNWRDIQNTRNALSQLSDRELDDIGLHRSDIDTWTCER